MLVHGKRGPTTHPLPLLHWPEGGSSQAGGCEKHQSFQEAGCCLDGNLDWSACNQHILYHLGQHVTIDKLQST